MSSSSSLGSDVIELCNADILQCCKSDRASLSSSSSSSSSRGYSQSSSTSTTTTDTQRRARRYRKARSILCDPVWESDAVQLTGVINDEAQATIKDRVFEASNEKKTMSYPFGQTTTSALSNGHIMVVEPNPFPCQSYQLSRSVQEDMKRTCARLHRCIDRAHLLVLLNLDQSWHLLNVIPRRVRCLAFGSAMWSNVHAEEKRELLDSMERPNLKMCLAESSTAVEGIANQMMEFLCGSLAHEWNNHRVIIAIVSEDRIATENCTNLLRAFQVPALGFDSSERECLARFLRMAK